MKMPENESIEIDLLVEAIYRRYGHDFRGYARAHLERRIKQFIVRRGYDRISNLIPELMHDEGVFERLLQELSITVTEMFRDPPVFRCLRKEVVPLLRTFPFLRVWVAGCATGEEAYSLAILLQEEALYERATIFATDFNDVALDKAREGILPLPALRKYSENYLAAGGGASFSDYYHAKYDLAALAPTLKKNMVFANHNLSTDSVFGDMHLIFCRNVLIYFDRKLRNRALGLFADSMVRGGFLCLGNHEDLHFSSVRERFKNVNDAARIYQLKGRLKA